MRVFVTGGTGFVGGHVLRALLDAGYHVRALVRPSSSDTIRELPDGVDVVEGDVLADDLCERMTDVDAVVHLVGIIREDARRDVTFQRLHVDATTNVVRTMSACNVRRLVHMSALGSDVQGATAYFRSKGVAEEVVRCSGLDWTVIRPSVMYGPGDSFVSMLARQIGLAPVVPVIGDGRYELQPVWAPDVASGFVRALSRDEAIGRAFDVGGPERTTYDELLDRIGAVLGKKRVRKLHVPLGVMRPLIRALEGFSAFPVTDGQLTMLLMNNTTDAAPYFDFFGIDPTKMEEGLCRYLGTSDASCVAATEPAEVAQS